MSRISESSVGPRSSSDLTWHLDQRTNLLFQLQPCACRCYWEKHRVAQPCERHYLCCAGEQLCTRVKHRNFVHFLLQLGGYQVHSHNANFIDAIDAAKLSDNPYKMWGSCCSCEADIQHVPLVWLLRLRIHWADSGRRRFHLQVYLSNWWRDTFWSLKCRIWFVRPY